MKALKFGLVSGVFFSLLVVLKVPVMGAVNTSIRATVNEVAIQSSFEGLISSEVFTSGTLRDSVIRNRAYFSNLGFYCHLSNAEFSSMLVVTVPKSSLSRVESNDKVSFVGNNIEVKISREYWSESLSEFIDDTVTVPAKLNFEVVLTDPRTIGTLTFTLPSHESHPAIEVTTHLSGVAQIDLVEESLLGKLIPWNHLPQ